MALFKTENMSFSYPLCRKKALDNINITIEKGEFVLLMGKSASGKSTLLRLLKKELSPAGELDGRIEVNAESLGFVMQNPQLSFVSERVRGELAFSLENQGKSHNEISVKIGEIASFFNIADILDCEISNLSGGEKATVSIASAMIGDAQALILDEPLAQLDAKSAIQLLNLLKRVNDELGTTIIMSSHISDSVVNLCSRIIILEDGKVICDDAPDNAVKNSELLPFFPVCTQLFEQRPLTVNSARKYAHLLNEKELVVTPQVNPIIKAKNITFAYEKHAKDILSSLSYLAYEGKINSIIGANGSGKTTLLKVLAGIKKSYFGKISIKGTVAYMPQNVRFLFSKDTVAEEISLKTAEKMDIADCLDRHPYDLSEGQAQRLAFGILLESEPDIFLLDEPTKAFDCFNKKMLKEHLKALCSQGKSIVMVSHDLDFVGEVSDYVSFLCDGDIAVTGGRREVMSSLDFYTTQLRRITKNHLDFAVSQEDLM